MAVHVVCGINLEGKREVLAVEPMYQESKESYKAIFDNLKSRSIQEVWLAISDAHKGLVAAVTESFIGCSWQRCKVHLMRNILAYVPTKEKEAFAARLKQIWNQPKPELARAYAIQLMNDFEQKYPKAIEILEEGLESSLQYYEFKGIDSRKISSTNMLERLNKEIRRRSRVVGVFPSMDSYIRLICCYLLEFSEDWETERCYIQKVKLQEFIDKHKAA